MRWILTLALLLSLGSRVLAAGSDEQYLDIYNEILQADNLQQSGQQEGAAVKYMQAQTDLQKLHNQYPTWNPDIVKFRMDYLADKLQALAKYLPNTNAPVSNGATLSATLTAPSSSAPPPGVGGPTVADLQQQNAGYQEQIRSLSAVNTEFEGKLKEALSVQPAAITPEQMARAEDKIKELSKEKDLLTVALQQAKDDATNSVAQAVAASEAKLADANKELESLKAQQAAQAQENAELKARAAASDKQAQDEVNRLKDASTESANALAALTKELELLKTGAPLGQPPAAPATAPGPVAAAPQTAEERDQLKAAMAELSADESEIAHLKDAEADAQKKLADANSQLEALKAQGAPSAASTNTAAASGNAPGPADAIKALNDERDQLKDELAARSKDLADAEARHNGELENMRAELQKAQAARDDLQKKLDAAQATAGATPAAPAAASSEDAAALQKIDQLKARIAVLEADPVPYTSDELSILKMPPPRIPAEPPKPMAAPHHMHSIKDLPAGASALWTEALKATMDKNYDLAEQKFNDVLKQDENNVYVLAYLANAEFAAGHLDECEKTVERALAVEPDDPGSLYLLGVLRYRQNKLDDAFDALSLSAQYNPTNSATQNFLGCVLADKGLRAPAETALRRAVQIDPDYAEAHFNLAVVYIGNQPPSTELARWHYKKAISLGHPRSDMLEKLLGTAPVGPAASTEPPSGAAVK
jgi:Tfp pilus assembly protein PilF